MITKRNALVTQTKAIDKSEYKDIINMSSSIISYFASCGKKGLQNVGNNN